MHVDGRKKTHTHTQERGTRAVDEAANETAVILVHVSHILFHTI